MGVVDEHFERRRRFSDVPELDPAVVSARRQVVLLVRVEVQVSVGRIGASDHLGSGASDGLGSGA